MFFKDKYKGSDLASICMNNWYRVYTRPGVEYKKTGRRGKQQIKKNYFDLKGYLVNNVFKRGPMIVERLTSAPIDILQSHSVKVGLGTFKMPSRNFRRISSNFLNVPECSRNYRENRERFLREYPQKIKIF